MNFEILAGPSMSGKTERLIERVLRQSHDNPYKNYIVIVPEQAGNAYEKKLIEKNMELFGVPGFMNIDVLGFNRLAHRIFEVMGIRETSVLEEYEKNMLVRVVSGRVSDSLKVYGGSVDRTGFTKEVKSLISELIQYNVSPEELEKCISDIPEGKESLAAKLSDLAEIYKGFLEEIDNRKSLMTSIAPDEATAISEERLKLVARLLGTNKECAITDGTVFVFDEYRGYTPDQLSVIKFLSKRAQEMTFSLCIDVDVLRDYLEKHIQVEEHSIFHQSYETINSLSEALGEMPKVEYIKPGNYSRPLLKHLSDHIFRYPAVECENIVYEEDKDSLTIYHTESREREIRVLAEDIRKEAFGGYRYKDIVVATGDIEGFDAYANRIFSEYGIPYFCDYSRKLKKNPYTEAILKILDILDSRFSYNSVFGFVKTGVMEINDTHAMDELENYVLRTGIRGRKLWEKTIRTYDKNANDVVKESYKKMNQARLEIMEALSPVLELEGISSLTVSEIIGALRKCMEELNFEKKMEASADLLEKEDMMAESRVMKSLYGVLDELFTQTEDLLGNIEMSIHDFTEIINSGINEISVGVIPPTIDAVSVCDIERSRIVGAKVVHIVGMNDGVIPQPKSKGRLLTDKDKEQVSELLLKQGEGKRLASTGVSQAQDELFLLYQLFSKATDKLTISYSDTNESGAGIEPSYLVGRICRLFPRLKVDIRRESATGGTKESDKSMFVSSIRRALDSKHSGKEIDEKRLKEIAEYMYFSGEKSELPFSDSIVPGLLFSNKAVPIPADVMGLVDLKLSVSKLESYARCPYSYFLKHILQLRIRPEKKMEYFDIGNVIHDTLEHTLKCVIDDYKNDWEHLETDELSDIAGDYFDVVWEEVMNPEDSEEEVSGKEERIRENLKDVAIRTAATLKEHICKGEFLPYGIEQEFTAEFIAKKPDGTEVPITLNGRIDRLDISEQSDDILVRVIDYKTGSKTFNPIEIQEGIDMQLLIYSRIVSDVLRKQFNDKNVIPAGMYYYKAENPVMDKNVTDEMFDSEDINKLEKMLTDSLVMKGVSNDDPKKLLNVHEKGLVDVDGKLISSSSVIPLNVTRTGGITVDSMLLSGEELNQLEDYSIQTMKETAEKLLSGHIEKSPIHISQDPQCSMCDYRSVCRFNDHAGTERRIGTCKGPKSDKLKELADKAEKQGHIDVNNARFKNR